MRSEGRNLDLWLHCPARMLKAAEEALETARIDPSFYGTVRQDRVKYFEDEVAKWKAMIR